jgi:alpha-tubulin suppressor-like RCC1 family protein
MPNFSGVWTLQEQFEAITEGNWTGITSIELYAWGHGAGGKVGDNTTTNKSSPVQIGTDITWTSDRGKMGAGNFHNMMIDNSNRLYAWGYNSLGNLGLTDTASRSSPAQVGALTNWSHISGGRFTSGAIKTDGTLWGWGLNTSGEVGDNTTVNKSSPVQIGSLTNWSLVAPGYTVTFAIKTDGTLWSWGANQFGQLGLNNRINRSSPVQIGSGTNWAFVSASRGGGHAITTSGELYVWGLNNFGQLGQNDTVARSSPVQIGALTNWSEIGGNFSGSYTVTGAVKTDGTMWSWGNPGNYLSLGHNDMVARSSPVQIGALTTWSQIMVGQLSFHAIKTDGTLWGWGYEGRGQVGDNTAVRRSSPVQVGSDTTWTALPQSAGSPTALLAISSYTTGMS